MRRALVTGASGFIGRAVVQALSRRGFDVHGTGRGIAAPGHLTMSAWHSDDLLTERGRERIIAATQPTHLVHLAWDAQPGRYRDSPDNPAWAAASLDLLTRAVAAGVERIVGIGTCLEYGPFSGACREDVSACRPTTRYGQSKLAAAEGFLALARSGAGVAWGRVFFPFGTDEAESRLIPALLQSLLAGKPFECSHGGQLRDFIFVEDLAQAIAALLESPLTGAVNLASGEPRSLRSVVEYFARQLDADSLVKFGARDVSGVDAEPMIAADITRLQETTGWRPAVGFEAGAERTLAWWRSRLSRQVS